MSYDWRNFFLNVTIDHNLSYMTTNYTNISNILASGTGLRPFQYVVMFAILMFGGCNHMMILP